MTQSASKRNGKRPQGDTLKDAPEQRLSLQEMIDLGVSAGQMLESPVVNVVNKLTIEHIFHEWAQSDPQESRKRESLYWELHALNRFMQRAGSLATRASEEINKHQEAQYQAEMEAQDRQGFY